MDDIMDLLESYMSSDDDDIYVSDNSPRLYSRRVSEKKDTYEGILLFCPGKQMLKYLNTMEVITRCFYEILLVL